MRFAFIKASDGKSVGDRPARKWWPIDRKAARKARLVVGRTTTADPRRTSTISLPTLLVRRIRRPPEQGVMSRVTCPQLWIWKVRQRT